MKALADFYILRSLTFSRLKNILKVQFSLIFSRLFGKYLLLGKPYILTIEPTNRCNLKCAQCATGTGKLTRPLINMTFSTFVKIIDELKNELCYIVMFNQGEPFLNTELLNFIEYAKQHRIYVISSTNGHFLNSDDICRKVVSSGLDQLIISLDGADQQTYQKYRTGGNFNRVIAGIQNLVRIKKELGKRRPSVLLQFLVMRHNEHQISAIKKLGQQLDVDRILFKTVQIDTVADASEFLPLNQKQSRYKREGDQVILQNSQHQFCSRLWTSSTILSDGSVVPCCFDKDGQFTFGHVNGHTNFTQIWSSERYEKFRRHFTNRERRAGEQQSIHICKNCTQGQKVYL